MKSCALALCCLLLANSCSGQSAEPAIAKNRTEKKETAKNETGKNQTAKNETAQYHTRTIDGWTVHVRDELLESDAPATERALQLLSKQLQEIVRAVPATAVVQLRQVPLWFSPEYAGVQPRAEYHPSAGWLRANQRDPAMAKGVEFTNVRIFERETKRMPNFALHELAHAYHDRVLARGFGNEAIKGAYRLAKASGLYDRVEQRMGDGRSAENRAYALTNPMEYFAECSEAFFSQNDFFPFNQQQLAQHDPAMFQLLTSLWNNRNNASTGAATGAGATGDSALKEDAADPAKLTLERIFASEEFSGDQVPRIHWLANGAYLALEAPQSTDASKDSPQKGTSDIVRIDAHGHREVFVPAEKLVPPGASAPLKIESYEFSEDLDLALIFTNSVKVWRQNTRGDYWTYRRSTGQLVRLGGDAPPSTLMFAKLSPDGNRVGYVHDNNLFVEAAAGGQVRQLTRDGTEEVINGTFDWVYEEEFGCRDGWRWSPDGQQIAYWQLDTHGVRQFTLVDNTTAKYPILKSFAYPKTGEQNSACRIGVVPAEGGDTRWLDIPGDTRSDFYIPRMQWDANSNELWVQRVNRLQNAVDVMRVERRSGKVELVLTERDSAWVDIQDEDITWLKNQSAFAWLSERDGWRHLYIVSRDGSSVRQVTKGDFDVIRVLAIDEESDRVWLLASPENPTQQYLFTVSLSGGGAPQRLTPADQAGWHDYAIAPDAKFAVHTHSAFGQPPRTEIVTLPEHAVQRTLAANDALRAAVEKLSKTPVEFTRVDIGSGIQLDAWLMKPADFDPSKRYPLLFYVYGEPAGQSVVDRWGDKRYLWNLMLAQQGYIVACVDNRGTPAPRGRQWRKAVYRRIGTLASEEQSAAARVLLERPYVDPARVGVWGWSGGGSMTLNLLFRYPDLYRMGMSVAAVPDMRLYDTIYQERYMGLPDANAQDYEEGSPITHAAGLKGDLLLVHGTGDDNCHVQGMEKLVNRLIELDKPFAMMTYPNRSHSINEGQHTTLHLYRLLTRYLHSHLPAGPKP